MKTSAVPSRLDDAFAVGTLAHNEKKAQEIFKIRESITVALRNANGWAFNYDVSLPTIKQMNESTQHITKSLERKYPKVKGTIAWYLYLNHANLSASLDI